MILHIPHSSTYIPNYNGFVANKEKISEEILKLTDWYTDELFSVEGATKIITPFSRIFCDVERFKEDDQEVMSQLGMGVLYSKFDDGAHLRTVDSILKERILNGYYDKHHLLFENFVSEELKNNGSSLIIDCHSFPNIPLNRSLIKEDFRPNINIGTDYYHTPKKLIDLSVSYFEAKGYSVCVDKPYSGSIVPMKYYQKDMRVQSIMIELNRGLYLENNTNVKSVNYLELKSDLEEFLKLILN